MKPQIITHCSDKDFILSLLYQSLLSCAPYYVNNAPLELYIRTILTNMDKIKKDDLFENQIQTIFLEAINICEFVVQKRLDKHLC